MKVVLRAPHGLKLWLVDWEGISQYWYKTDQYRAIKNEVLEPVLLPDWFDESNRLIVGWVENYADGIAFGNGTHRTRLLAKYLKILPLGGNADVYRNKNYAKYFLRRIDRNELFELPDLPIKYPQIRART